MTDSERMKEAQSLIEYFNERLNAAEDLLARQLPQLRRLHELDPTNWRAKRDRETIGKFLRARKV